MEARRLKERVKLLEDLLRKEREKNKDKEEGKNEWKGRFERLEGKYEDLAFEMDVLKKEVRDMKRRRERTRERSEAREKRQEKEKWLIDLDLSEDSGEERRIGKRYKRSTNDNNEERRSKVREIEREKDRVLLMAKGRRWKGQEEETYIEELLDSKFVVEMVQASGNNKKVWLLFSSKLERDLVWANREAMRREEVFYLDEFLTMEERRGREQLVRIGKKLKREGKDVEIENKRIWIVGEDGGEWFKWDAVDNTLKKVRAEVSGKEGEVRFEEGGVKRNWREERGERKSKLG